jgi:LacI family transcriptional regulator
MGTKLEDVAKAAGVSITTVSLVLSGRGRISEHTREKVFRAVEEVGYKRKTYQPREQPNDFKNVAILVNIDYEWAFIWGFVRPLIEEIETISKQNGYNLILIPISRHSATNSILQKITDSFSGGIVSLHYCNPELFDNLEAMGIPVVLVMNNNYQDRFHSVCVDDYQGAYEGALHLINLGHSNICYIYCERPDLPALITDRFIGFKKAMDEYDLSVPEKNKIKIDLDNEQKSREQIQNVFSSPHRPTAVFFLDDELAMHVIEVFKEMNIAVPEDVSIIAPGDVLDYNLPHTPQITTLKINTSLMGRITGDLLFDRIKNHYEDIHVLKVKQQLFDRGSCKEPGVSQKGVVS